MLEIAEQYGVTRSAVIAAFIKHGINHTHDVDLEGFFGGTQEALIA